VTPAAVEARALTKRFDKLVAVDALDLRIPTGEAFALLGPNGAGKTTAIKMLTTLLDPTSGAAFVEGHDVRRESAAVRRAIGYVPQVLSADGGLTGRQNLEIFAKLYDVPGRERAQRVADALAFMGLQDAADRAARTYSGGMIRRLEIAQSILHRPRVLFLDEPTIGLDPVARASVWSHIARLRAEHRTTLVLTTHYMEEADSLCDRVAIMNKGRIVALDAPERLKASIGKEGATLDDVFAYYTGNSLDASGGDFADAKRARRTARRLG
jgi:ABC-2 type transport system ATP-binding protein